MTSQMLEDLLNTISKQNDFFMTQTIKQSEQINELQEKCASLELILNHIVIKSISENDQATYATITNIASSTLSLLPEENKSDDFAEKLKSILSIREQVMPKPILRLVKPQKP